MEILEFSKMFVDVLIFMILLWIYLFGCYFYFDDCGFEKLNINCSVF